MSLSSVRPYFRARLVEAGLTEWQEPFDFENIPSTVLDRSFNLAPLNATGIQKNNLDQTIQVNQTVRVLFKGFREPWLALDEAILKAEAVIAACLSPQNFQGTISPIVGVFFGGVDFIALDDASNDNIVICEIAFEVLTALCVE